MEKPGLNVAGGAIGIGEITSIPTAPAIADAYPVGRGTAARAAAGARPTPERSKKQAAAVLRAKMTCGE